MRFIVGTRAAESVDAAKRLARDLSESGIDGRVLSSGLLSTNFWHQRFEVRGLLARSSIDAGALLDVYDHKRSTHCAAEVFDLARPRPGWQEALFLREAAALDRVRHPLLPRLVKLLVDDDVGVAVLVEQRILGANLDTVVRQNGPIAPEHIGWMMADVLTALAPLHKAGLVHRDIKPASLVLGVDAVVRLVDLGRVGLVAGGDGVYVAPELRNGQRSPRADFHSLALTMLALVAARSPDRLPRRGSTIDVDAAAPSLVRSTRALLQRMTNVAPEARPASATEVRSALGTHASTPRPAAVAMPSVPGEPVFARVRVPSGKTLYADLRKVEWQTVARVTYEVKGGFQPDLEVLYWSAAGALIDAELLQLHADTFAAWWRSRGGRPPIPRTADDAFARTRELSRKAVQIAQLVGIGGSSRRLHAIDLGGPIVAPMTAAVLEAEDVKRGGSASSRPR